MLKLICFVFAAVHFFSEVESVNYVRWGRTSCPTGASILYTGYAATSHYTHVGGGAEYLCLTDQPEWNNIVPGRQPWGGYIYGTEYEFGAGWTKNQPFSYDNNGGSDLNANHAPCVVCIRSGVTEVVMIPGKFSCPVDNMNLEYNGHLVSQHYGYAGKSSWACLDQAPEGIPGMGSDAPGALMYPTQVSCAEKSILCPPYQDGNEISCAVCTM